MTTFQMVALFIVSAVISGFTSMLTTLVLLHRHDERASRRLARDVIDIVRRARSNNPSFLGGGAL